MKSRIWPPHSFPSFDIFSHIIFNFVSFLRHWSFSVCWTRLLTPREAFPYFISFHFIIVFNTIWNYVWLNERHIVHTRIHPAMRQQHALLCARTHRMSPNSLKAFWNWPIARCRNMKWKDLNCSLNCVNSRFHTGFNPVEATKKAKNIDDSAAINLTEIKKFNILFD